jgi:hypothetical protein
MSSALLRSLQHLLCFLEVLNVFWATWKSATFSELLGSLQRLRSCWKSATSSELLGSLQRSLNCSEVCNVLEAIRKSATASELLGSMLSLLSYTWKNATSCSYLEVCNGLWAILGSVQRLLSYWEVCNIFWATWKYTTSSGTSSELRRNLNVFRSTWKSATFSELLRSLQRLLSYLEVCNVFWAT